MSRDPFSRRGDFGSIDLVEAERRSAYRLRPGPGIGRLSLRPFRASVNEFGASDQSARPVRVAQARIEPEFQFDAGLPSYDEQRRAAERRRAKPPERGLFDTLFRASITAHTEPLRRDTPFKSNEHVPSLEDATWIKSCKRSAPAAGETASPGPWVELVPVSTSTRVQAG